MKTTPIYWLVLAVTALHYIASPKLLAQEIHFAALGKKGKASVSSGVLVDAKGTLATVVEIGSDAAKANLVHDGKNVALTLIARDADSRLALYTVPEEARGWMTQAASGSSISLQPSQPLTATKPASGEVCRHVARIFTFQGKVLPLAVLRVNHTKAAPKPGTGIFDANGKLVGIVRQPVYNAPMSSYCLPVEVIERITQDHQRNQRIRRCWCGIIMDELVAAPLIESVRPDSPAAKAGLKKGDVILGVGPYKVSRYDEVVDAYYYLIAGQATKFSILRGTETLEVSVVPQVRPGR